MLEVDQGPVWQMAGWESMFVVKSAVLSRGLPCGTGPPSTTGGGTSPTAGGRNAGGRRFTPVYGCWEISLQECKIVQ